jgi:hypothetical protein
MCVVMKVWVGSDKKSGNSMEGESGKVLPTWRLYFVSYSF